MLYLPTGLSQVGAKECRIRESSDISIENTGKGLNIARKNVWGKALTRGNNVVYTKGVSLLNIE